MSFFCSIGEAAVEPEDIDGIDDEESLKYYNKVHEINETYLNVKLWIGVLYKNLSQHDLSIKYLYQFIDFKKSLMHKFQKF